MPRFFVEDHQISDGIITITGETAHHIARSLRMAVGDSVTICSESGNAYACELSSFNGDKEIVARILNEIDVTSEPPFRAILFQALPKGDKMDSIIQKAVECGVSEIYPFESTFCIMHSKADSEDKKTDRRNRIAAEAAKQSGRSILPIVHKTISFKEMLELACQTGYQLFCYEGDHTTPLPILLNQHPLTNTQRDNTIAIVIGSEGGFSQEEADMALEKGMQLANLGRRILRTETASSFVLSCLVYHYEL